MQYSARSNVTSTLTYQVSNASKIAGPISKICCLTFRSSAWEGRSVAAPGLRTPTGSGTTNEYGRGRLPVYVKASKEDEGGFFKLKKVVNGG